MHVNISKIQLFTQVVVSNIICNENFSIKLENNAKQKHFHECSLTFGPRRVFKLFVHSECIFFYKLLIND